MDYPHFASKSTNGILCLACIVKNKQTNKKTHVQYACSSIPLIADQPCWKKRFVYIFLSATDIII